MYRFFLVKPYLVLIGVSDCSSKKITEMTCTVEIPFCYVQTKVFFICIVLFSVIWRELLDEYDIDITVLLLYRMFLVTL